MIKFPELKVPARTKKITKSLENASFEMCHWGASHPIKILEQLFNWNIFSWIFSIYLRPCDEDIMKISPSVHIYQYIWDIMACLICFSWLLVRRPVWRLAEAQMKSYSLRHYHTQTTFIKMFYYKLNIFQLKHLVQHNQTLSTLFQNPKELTRIESYFKRFYFSRKVDF